MLFYFLNYQHHTNTGTQRPNVLGRAGFCPVNKNLGRVRKRASVGSEAIIDYYITVKKRTFTLFTVFGYSVITSQFNNNTSKIKQTNLP